MSDPLLIDDDDRYGRLRLIAWWDQARISQATVLVVGAGALGNEVLKNLALLGVGKIHVVDCDTIEPSNLARSVLFRRRDSGRPKAEVAAAAVLDLNPEIRVSAIHGNIITDVGLGLFRNADVVIGCLDNREARLWVNRQCWKVGTPWIDGGIQEINGVVKVFVPPDSACYECAMSEDDYRLINLRYSCPLLSREDMQAGKVPTAPTIASMIGGLQTQEALKLLHGMPVAAGQAHIYNGVSNRFYTTAFQRREECLSHETFADIFDLPISASTHTAADFFEAVRSQTGDAGNWQLRLDRDLVVSIECAACQNSRPILRPASAVDMRHAECQQCGQIGKPNLTGHIECGSQLAREPLVRLGIPPFDIVRVATQTCERFVQLAGDRDSVVI
jgi:molybdopterin/thiamine biosynthesis adenylyltransferase